MTGSRRSALRLAMPALLLALLVPARAISLCCLDMVGTQTPAARHSTHGSMPHHRSEAESVPVGQALAPLPTSVCVILATPAPVLRERGRSGDAAAGVGDLALASTAGLGYPPTRDRPVHPWLTSVPQPAGLESPHPLRL
ncbi:MAG: hypothetical protein ACREMK_03030 [Gemmatimonadota bacterium]